MTFSSAKVGDILIGHGSLFRSATTGSITKTGLTQVSSSLPSLPETTQTVVYNLAFKVTALNPKITSSSNLDTDGFLIRGLNL